MSLGGFTLADRLGARTVPCRVPGCTRTWLQLGGKSLALGAKSVDPNDPGAGMCDPCKKKLATLQDKQRRCDVPGCPETFTWTVAEQLESFATHKPPPRRICGSCEAKLATLQDQQIACTVPGCTRTATLSKRTQLLNHAAEAEAARKALEAPPPAPSAPVSEPHDAATADPVTADPVTADATTADVATTEAAAAEAPADETAPAIEGAPAVEQAAAAEAASGNGHDHGHAHAHAEVRGRQAKAHANGHEKPGKPGKVTITGVMCGPCHDVAQRIQDRAVHCGISGCKRKWIWKADDQLQAFAAGKPNEPPRRMCETCRANFGKLLDREVRCRTSGCKKTWTWSRFDQLDACVADKAPPKAPARMCESCFDAFAKLKDVERPCRKSGCKRTWTDKRGAQLARLVRGKSGDPYPQYCVECQKELGDLADREINCKTDGCQGTWTWTREQQLAAGVRPVPKSEMAPEATAEGASEAAPVDLVTGAAPPVVVAEAGPPGAASELPLGVTGPDTSEEAVATAAVVAATATATATTPGRSGGPQPQHGHGQGQGQGQGKNRGRRGRRQRQIQPPERLCHACAEFLKDRKTLEIPCSQCATPIYWPPESQLQSHLGNWATPSLCGACKRDATEAARRAAKEIIRQQMDATAHEHSHPVQEPPASEPPVSEAPAPAPVVVSDPDQTSPAKDA